MTEKIEIKILNRGWVLSIHGFFITEKAYVNKEKLLEAIKTALD